MLMLALVAGIQLGLTLLCGMLVEESSSIAKPNLLNVAVYSVGVNV